MTFKLPTIFITNLSMLLYSISEEKAYNFNAIVWDKSGEIARSLRGNHDYLKWQKYGGQD